MYWTFSLALLVLFAMALGLVPTGATLLFLGTMATELPSLGPEHFLALCTKSDTAVSLCRVCSMRLRVTATAVLVR